MSSLRIFLIAGAVLWVVVGLYFLDMRELMEDGVHARGEVVDLEMRQAEGSLKKSFHPVVVFETGDGQSIRFVGDVGSRPPAYEIGEEVSVFYLPDDPEEVYLDSWMGLYFLPLVLGALGSIFLVSSFGIWIASRRSSHPPG